MIVYSVICTRTSNQGHDSDRRKHQITHGVRSEQTYVVNQQVCRHGIPKRLRSDNGPQFHRQELTAICKSYGIKEKKEESFPGSLSA